MQLPTQWNTTAAAGSQWVQTFTMLSGDGTLMDLTGLDWEFVVRPSVADVTAPALVQVSTTPSAQGVISVDLPAATVTVTLTPTATTVLSEGVRPHALWSQPGTDAATCWVTGSFRTALVASA